MKLFDLNDYRVTSVELKKYIDNKIGDASEIIYEYDNFESFPESGSSQKLYIDTANKSVYYWDNSSYVCIGKGKIDENDIIDALGYPPTVVKIIRW